MQGSQKAWLALLLIVTTLVACGEPLATPEPVYLQVTGSMAMEALATDLASAFHDRSPTIRLDVTGLGTHYGLEALRRGEADIALVSWLPGDLDEDELAVPIARDGLAIIVHPSNPVEGLGLLQLQDLFGGRASEWQAVGGRIAQGTVQPVSREEGSGARDAFEALAMEGHRVSPLARVAFSPQSVVEIVAAQPGAIGYVSMVLVTPRVKVLRIEGELPTPESVGQSSYPLTRDLWLVTVDPPPTPVQQFIDFVRSPAGQQIVGQRLGRIK